MAEHDLSKIVDADGEVFNFKDASAVHVVDDALSSSSTNPVQNKVVKEELDKKALLNITYGEQGYISYSAANSDLLLEKLKLGSLSLYNYGTVIKLYEYDADDEANAVLVWDSSTLTGTTLQKFINGQDLGTIYTSTAGKCIRVDYDGHQHGSYNYIRALGVFMTPKQVDSSHKATAVFRVNGTDYKSYQIDTYGSLVTAVCTSGNYYLCSLKFTPSSSAVRMRFFGFRCLNTYTGTDAVLLGRSSSTNKLATARKLAVSLSNTSTDSTFDGSADQTAIKVSGTLPIGNGGTGATSAIEAEYNILNQVADIDSTLDGNRKIALCNQTKSASNGVFRWIKLSNVWTWIKSQLTAVTGVNISGNAATASAAQSGSTLATAISDLETSVQNQNKFFHTETLNVTDGITRFLKISFSGRVGRASAIVLIGANNGNDSSAFRLSWFYDGTTQIGNFGRELFSVGDINKKPLVYYDNTSFYIGLSDAGNWGATISVMLSCENPGYVSYATVTRTVATGSDKANLPLQWVAVYSKDVSTIVKGSLGSTPNTLYIL